jgi:hypothetical protein
VLGVVTVLPVFPYSRQPDVPYVRPDSPLACAPAMLFKDSVTVSSTPTTPLTGLLPDGRQGGPFDHLSLPQFVSDKPTSSSGDGLLSISPATSTLLNFRT